jgi:hypothetical protein
VRRWVCAVALALAAGCEIPDVETPCTDVTCSGHGECRVVADVNGEHPQCQCESGFMRTPDGTGCYRPPGPDGDADGD